MSIFALHLESSTQYERIDGVESFVGEDASGQFGLLASHERFVTSLKPALARFLTQGRWQYLALAGGTLYFDGRELHVATGRYARGDDYREMRARLRERVSAEDRNVAELRASVRRLETEMLRQLHRLQRGGAPS